MPARKVSISLAEVKALSKHMQEEGKMLVQLAKQARKHERKQAEGLDGKGFDDATSSRIAKAGAFAVVADTIEAVENVDAKGKVEVRELVVKRREIRDTPFDRLIERKILAKDDRLNRAFRLTGEELLRDAEMAGLNSVSAIDPGSVGSQRMNDGAFIRSDVQQAALYRVVKAKAVLNPTEATVVDLVLLQRQNVTSVGKHVAPGRSDNVAAGIAVYVLQTALCALVDHYGLRPTQGSTVHPQPS
jgi:hypothetical protein